MFNEHTRQLLSKHIRPHQIERLERRVSIIVGNPPMAAPSVRAARKQLTDLAQAASKLSAEINAAVPVYMALHNMTRGEPDRFSPVGLLSELNALRNAAMRARVALPRESKPGGNAKKLQARAIISAVLEPLEDAGVPVSQTGSGIAWECCDAVLQDAGVEGSIRLMRSVINGK